MGVSFQFLRVFAQELCGSFARKSNSQICLSKMIPQGGVLPKPTQLKILNGNPGGRPLNKKEPSPTKGIPSSPAVLKGQAKEEWKRITTELDKLGLLAKVDRSSLLIYCQAVGDVWELTKKMEGQPFVIEKGNNCAQANPLMALRARAMDQVFKYSQMFGLNPASRSRIQLPDGKDADDDEFLNRNRDKKATG
jgi:P27 family predicted phage terminase small subunit